MNRLGIILVIALLIVAGGVWSVGAQTSGGQFCVRSFEDSNGNGVLDPENERLLTQGINIELLAASSNVVIGSALLADSPNASSGIVCFQNLPDGEYTVMMTSAEYQATTPAMFSAFVGSAAIPTVIEFGAQRIVGEVAQGGTSLSFQERMANMSEEELQALILRVAISLAGAVLVMIFVLIIGFVIYYLRLRSRPLSPVAYNPASVQAAPPDAAYSPPPAAYAQPPAPPTPSAPVATDASYPPPFVRSEPPITAEDTNQMRPLLDDDDDDPEIELN